MKFLDQTLIKEGTDMSTTTTTARTFLGFNAAFSAFTGAALIAAPGALSQAMFANPADWMPLGLGLLGAGLLIFALNLVSMAVNRFVSKGEVLLVVLADIGWLLASAAVVLLATHLFTDVGTLAVALVAAFVATFAIGQYLGARKIVTPASKVAIRSSNGVLKASVERAVRAPASTVWDVMTDHPAYADVASNISKVEVLSGDGLGMRRRCFGPKGENWIETCDLFDEGRSYGFKIHTEAPDYPYPISDLQGRWSVESEGSGSRFSVDIEATPKGGFLSRALFTAVAKRQFKTVLIDLADAWSERMEREVHA